MAHVMEFGMEPMTMLELIQDFYGPCLGIPMGTTAMSTKYILSGLFLVSWNSDGNPCA
jgi:hypothetical protein